MRGFCVILTDMMSWGEVLMKNKKKSSVTIIGGADGNTSIFIAGKMDRQPLKIKIWNAIYQYKRRQAAKKIVVGTHTLEETVKYARKTYGMTELSTDTSKYQDLKRNLKESLMWRQKKDQEISMDFHVYELKTVDGCLEMEIDYNWKKFAISYSGRKKEAKQFRKISQELYRYYGVSEQDIKEMSERYHTLLAALSV